MALTRHNSQLFGSILWHLTFVAASSPRLALPSPLTATDKMRQYFSVGPDAVFVFTLLQLRGFSLNATVSGRAYVVHASKEAHLTGTHALQRVLR